MKKPRKKRDEIRFPKILNERIISKLTAAARNGAFHTELAALAGVRRETIYDWLRRGEREYKNVYDRDRDPVPSEAAYLELSMSIEKALSEWEAEHRAIISKAALGYIREKTKNTQRVLPDGGIETSTVVEKSQEMDWRASLALLERRFPERYIRKSNEDPKGKDDKVEIKVVLDDGLRADEIITGEVETDEEAK